MSRTRPFRTVLAALAALLLGLAPGPSRAEPPSREGGKYALLIGVNRYEDRLRPLKYAERDVEALRDVLVAHGYERDNVWLMTYHAAEMERWLYPERKNILDALRRLLRGRSPRDSVLVAFAGHGVQFKDDDPECYLCPVDADLGDRDSLVSVTEIYDLLEHCKAGVKLVVVDACRNDPRLDTSRAVEQIKLSSAHFQPQEPPGGLAVLYSCSLGQEALEDDELKHGIFFHYLIQGLDGKAANREDGQVSLGGLYDYVSRHVDDYAQAHQKRSQRPSLLQGKLSGTMTLLTVPPAAAEARPAPPAPLPEPGREVRRLAGHQRTVTGVAFLPDGRRALSGSFDGTLRLWDVDTGAESACLQGADAGWVRGVAVSADSRSALSGGEDRLVRLWDLDAGTEVRQLRGHTGTVYAVSISPDGRLGLSAGADKTVRLWDLAAGTEVRVFRGHTAAVCAVAFAADGRSALSGSSDHTVRLWDVDTGAELRRFEGHSETVLSVALSGDGRLALSGSTDRTMRVWDARTGRQIHCFGGDTDRVLAVAFSPDGSRVLCGSADRALHLWDVATGKSLGTLSGHDTAVQCVAFSPDGRRALSGAGEPDRDDSVRLWQLPN
jgi:WD40 repeat protein